ncbi:YhbD family protein [Paenibacillus pini]|uniref:DUF4004 domain-containing protein n=1 Tax=Paenibacillus pini JCM 16418 TaxID=1236976 RepID=W7Z028_9BACL|nr:YhbD family protein [Paenibacillus pini]GAF10306.1 hypothetical protein JCM16418_4485 [Paenibacillus pini JCM 16418]
MNEDELISKKELLEWTGISYGQLYRWKRKNLIPEDWFIRKSSYTGQETFFPREKILQRIDRIKNMKDGLSLDELADVFSPSSDDISLGAQKLVERNIVTQTTLHLYEEVQGSQETLAFSDMVCLFVLEKLLQSGEMTQGEGKMLIHLLKEHEEHFASRPCEVVLFRKMGVTSFVLAESMEHIYFDKGVKWVVRMSVTACIEELKMSLNEREE